MQSFTYVARDTKTAREIKADIEAENETTAAKILTDRGLVPLEIKVKPSGSLFGLTNRVPVKHRIIFSRQLSTLVGAGLPLVQSLNSVRAQTSNKPLKAVVESIITEVEAGTPLAEALSHHPKVFDGVYVALVAAGETSGTLDKTLERLATQQEKQAETTSKIRGAMFYPAIVLLVLMAVVAFLLTTVLPKVQDLYRSLPGTSLPPVTRILLATSNFVTRFWWLILLFMIGCGVYFYYWSRSPNGRQKLDEIKMRLPGFGTLTKQLYMARFARTAGTLVASGVPILQMLTTTANAVGNSQIANSINKAAEEVKGGKTLSAALRTDDNFMELVPNMIEIGEQSGTLDDMLNKLADYYERELDTKIKSLTTVIEPVLMVVVGVIALLIVAAVLLPIYSLAGKNLVPH